MDKAKKKKKNPTPEVQFRLNLDNCSKTKDLSTAISLYESALSTIRFSNNHFNSFLYICSNAVSDPSTKKPAIEFGFRIFDHMVSSNVTPNEATVTAVARLAAATDDGDKAFELAKGMGNCGKLRTYGPTLFCYCKMGEADKAYQVEDHMRSIGLQLEEAELVGLLKVSVEKEREEKVYQYLHKLRMSVRSVSESAAEIIHSWFGGEVAAKVGLSDWDMGQVKEAILQNGGGWHGRGWLGKGKWTVQRSRIAPDGRCLTCREQLVCVDIDKAETERFAEAVASLAMEREVHSNFKEFQDWLEQHSEYDAVVDAANVGLYQQNFAEGGFSIAQLVTVVKELHSRSNKWPLVVLHKKRLRALLQNACYRELLEEWINEKVLYGTPFGSNDDWYWLYAAVKRKCLLLTNDEMRDHIFELLGSSFFAIWKERHQVKYTFVKGEPKLLMPPTYSVVIQESENGSWHVPLSGEIAEESSRIWLCITRQASCESNTKQHASVEASEVSELVCSDQIEDSCHSDSFASQNGLIRCSGLAGKRKERSPSHSSLQS
ncbi:proteinaceous RNase P 2-like [Nicotiana tabacum]|uniref:ribonuclease P n=2 Tax=Nicotiana tabacum TaxID=4097 RepID=A0A1S3XUB7_TOBAC|nr:PREDICTED: proteinaceous RNase P 2-like [Nicotiana tabacum]XP_016443537.1 PREDICTED: proteinaceous RNase P 2-like [Nicotiana tabacum]XP_016443538.1 PREDICTED: proteinaceous RNase P 2-like [Nicotiana tabacum]